MSMQNLGDLRASIVGWMYDRTDLAPMADDFIQLCHSDLNRVLRTRHQLGSQTMTIDGDGTAPIPDDYLQFREVLALTNPQRVLEYVVPTYEDWAYPYQYAEWPSVFTINGPNIVVRPLTTAQIRFDYWAKIPAMVNADDANWLFVESPGIYLYGCLKHACLYIGDKPRAADMSGMQAALIEALISDDRIGMYSRARATVSRRGP